MEEALSALTCKPQQPLRLSINRCRLHRRPPTFLSSPRPLPSLSSVIRIESCNTNHHPNPNSNPSKPVASSSSLAFLRLPLCVAVTAAAVFISGLSPLRPQPALARAESVVTRETPNDAVPEEERILERRVASHPDDVGALKSLMELKIRNRKLSEVLDICSRLIELEPDEVEWRLLRGHTYCSVGESEMARPVFEEILAKDPDRVEAYHGLVMSTSQSDAGNELREVEKRIGDAIERLRKGEKKIDQEVREFQLLIAQIRVIQGDYMAALKVYQDLVKEEPRDYRPYLCQGIIYTLLRNKDKAEQQFAKYKRLVPKDHPYARYFEDNVFSDLRDK